MLIEVFRAGSPAAIAAGITAADLADVAAFDCANNPVPNVIGHPTTDSPAHSAVRSFKAEGDKLFADVPEQHPRFQAIVEGIKGGSILNRSMGFFSKRHPSNPTPGKIAPKHLGFLGGAAPGIAGMPALASYFAANPDTVLAFAADGTTLEVTGDPADAVVFDAEPAATPAPTGAIVVTEPPAPAPAAVTQDEQTMATEAEIAERERILAEREQTFAASQRSARENANAASVDGLVAAAKVLPADRDDLVAAFNAVDGGDEITFASDANKKGSPVSIIAAIMAKGGAVTPAGGDRLSPTDTNPTFAADGSANADRVADLDKVRQEKTAKFGK